MTVSDLITQLRMETGQRMGCPICGSLAWHEGSGHCHDCGLNLAASVKEPLLSPDYPEPRTDPKHPDHHSLLSELWDNREGK